MKKVLQYLTIFLLGVLIGWWGTHATLGNEKNLNKKETIKIGVIAPLTGKGASRGESARQGLELALQKINEGHLLPNDALQLVYQDVPLDKATEAPRAFSLLTDVEKVTAVIGPMGSNVALSVTPLVDAAKTPVIIHTASALDITKNNEYTFRLWPTAHNYADVILKQLQKQYTKIAALTAINDNSIDLFDVLNTKFQEDNHVSFITDERATVDETDFRTQLTKIKRAKPDVLFINLFEGQIGIAAKQARELHIDVPIFTNAVTSPLELEGAQGALEDAWFPQFAGYTENAQQEFIKKFEKEPSNPDSAGAAHDALIIFAQAIHEVGTDKEKIHNYIHNTTFTGAIGEVRFSETGDAVVPLTTQIIKDGKIVNL